MNLRAKKENLNPRNALKENTNVSRVSKEQAKNKKLVQDLKEANSIPAGGKARKTKKTQQRNKSTTKKEVSPAAPADTFGFKDDDFEEEVVSYNGELSEFDPSRPYRLALYVKPSKRSRVDPKVLKEIQKWSIMKFAKAPEIQSPNRTQWAIPHSTSTPKEKSRGSMKENGIIPKKKALVQPKITDLLCKSPRATRAGNNEQQFTSFFSASSSSSADESIETPAKNVTKRKVAGEPAILDDDIPIHFKKPSRRSYVKKPKVEEEPEPEEPSSDELMKCIEKEKKKKKSRKAAKEEDEEFEKWSRSINSMFNEIEQFEVSID